MFGTIALNLKVIVVCGGKVRKTLENIKKSESFFCNAALWVDNSNCSELNPDHECSTVLPFRSVTV